MIKSKPLRILLFVCLALFGVGAILVPNLLQRRNADHGFDKLADGRCAGELRWSADDLPIVLVTDPTISPAWEAATIHAMRTLNQELGLEVFRHRVGEVGGGGTAIIARREIWIDTTNTSTHGLTAIDVGLVSCRFKQGEISLPGLLRGGEYMEAAARHELGHALGLAHDMIEGSVMWPKVQQWSRSSKLTEKDVKLLRGAWSKDH